MPTGIAAVDDLLQGGLPVGALTEMTGPECSGRTSLALSFIAQVTRAEKICAWVDVSNALSPESAAACGVDLARLLWIRCGVAKSSNTQASLQEVDRCSNKKVASTLPKKYFVPKPAVKGLHGGGHRKPHPTRFEAKGNGTAAVEQPAMAGDVICLRCAEPQRKVRVEREPSFQTHPTAILPLAANPQPQHERAWQTMAAH